MTLTARLTRRRLADPAYVSFPLRIGALGVQMDTRAQHVRAQIELVLFTLAGERSHRPEFGAGVKGLVFEPNASPLWQVTQRRLSAALADALLGEVDPRSLEVDVGAPPDAADGIPGDPSQLWIRVSYALAAIGQREDHLFSIGGA
jgi:hypothetical protein